MLTYVDAVVAIVFFLYYKLNSKIEICIPFL